MQKAVSSTFSRWAFGSALTVGTLSAAGYFLNSVDSLTAQTSPPAVTASPHAKENLTHANALSQAFRASSNRVLPAVVSIQNVVQPKLVQREIPRRSPRQVPPGMQRPGMEELDPLLKRFFGDMPDLEDMQPQQPGGRESSGSGVIIDSSGIILTNNHVVAGGGKLRVKMHDGREFDVVDVKTDPSTDLAVIKIKSSVPLPYAVLGDSDQMMIGDWVLALGQPFGLQDTVTAGIISAKGRDIGITRHNEFLQTDAAINPGNSGGPLVNLQGEVVGINTAISSSSGGFQGIGFAVPVNVAKWVSTQLLKDGAVHRGYLGVGIQPVDQALAEQLGLSTSQGALITDVQPDSPAAAAGMMPQDVVVEFAGQPVHSPRQLQAVVGRAPLGTKQPLVVLRDGKKVTLQVSVREQPKGYGEVAKQDEPEAKPSESSSFDELGLNVSPLTPAVAKQLGVKVEQGVVVTDVEQGSVAAQAGLDEGDVITQVGRTPVNNVEEFRAAVKTADLSKGVMLLVKGAEGSRFVVLKK
ncbi:putative periplasmic serine endoprotease DegP-like precursor [Anatilimnocola aggregata]|uniref:Putative periplasmic serine endoprotease DegP-like n=1 Tax=Anatilimnocola aggregata TaxID=2528021 RepID=A0A517Y7D3_9BACT|nr:Do family serine endopeptidase [Anatilimnocola aggregata]QDU26052.1 putative periplasmic serine endoprotease DegP-like precursor [Anatilimnocola aggregata]